MLNAQFALHMRDCTSAHLGIGSVRMEDPLYPFQAAQMYTGVGSVSQKTGYGDTTCLPLLPYKHLNREHTDREEGGERERFKTGKGRRGIFKKYLENVLCMAFQNFL